MLVAVCVPRHAAVGNSNWFHTLANVERVKCFMHAEVYSSKREGEGKVIPL